MSFCTFCVTQHPLPDVEGGGVNVVIVCDVALATALPPEVADQTTVKVTLELRPLNV